MEFDSLPHYDEARDAAGRPRAGYGDLLAALEGVDLGRLSVSVSARLADRGVSFGERPFVIDPVPRIIAGGEWHALEAGLIQRTRALNAFLPDAYGEQRAVAAGILEAGTIEEAEGFEPDLVGTLPAYRWPAAIVGFDIVRAPTGELLVLEDNLRTPSGFAYALAARQALQDSLPENVPEPRPIDPYRMLGDSLGAAAPSEGDEPCLVVLTDGPGNVAYFEHAEAAEHLGAILATPGDLVADGKRLLVRDGHGSARAVDVVYRRTDEDRIRDEHGRVTPVAEALLPFWLGGTVGLINAFGNGIADDKLLHGHVEDFIRFYLGEEPLVRSVPTTAVSAEPEATIAELERLVIKPRHGHGGKGVVIGPHASEAELDALAGELVREPHRYIAQPTVNLSHHPTVIDGQLEPRHVDLRAFVFAGGELGVLPGGLSRVALRAGAMIVNSSQQGGGKDTWVLDG